MSGLSMEEFAIGMATLERFFRRKLHETDRNVYYAAVKTVNAKKWLKCVEYACQQAKMLPKPVELRGWLGLGPMLTPAEEEGGFVPGTIRGLRPAELCKMAAEGVDLPLSNFDDDLEEASYLVAVHREPPPKFGPGANPDVVLAHVRRLGELGAADHASFLEEKRRAEEENRAEAAASPVRGAGSTEGERGEARDDAGTPQGA